jgi:hypothetical protein
MSMVSGDGLRLSEPPDRLSVSDGVGLARSGLEDCGVSSGFVVVDEEESRFEEEGKRRVGGMQSSGCGSVLDALLDADALDVRWGMARLRPRSSPRWLIVYSGGNA